MNYLELCQRTRQECGIQGEGPASVENQSGLSKRIVDWVQQADIEIQSVFTDWDFLWSEFMEDTVEGSKDISKPSDLGEWDIKSFAISRGTATGKKLTFMEYKEFRDTQLNTSTNAEPSTLTILPNNNLRLLSPADGTYEIYGVYWKVPTPLSGNSSVPLYNSKYHQIIIERARMFFYEDQEAWDNYQAANGNYQEWLGKLTAKYAPNQQRALQADPEDLVVRPV